MSNHTVKFERTYIDTTKFQFITSNYTSVMEKTPVAMAFGKNCSMMTFACVKAAASSYIITYFNQYNNNN